MPAIRITHSVFPLPQAAAGDLGRDHPDRTAHECSGRTRHLFCASASAGPAGPRSVRTGLRAGPRKAVPGCYSGTQRLANCTRRSGWLSQQSVVQDVAAKIVCDNLQALVSITAHADADLPDNKRINHAYAHTALKPLMPILLLGGIIGRKVGALLRGLLGLIAGRTTDIVKIIRNPGSPAQSHTRK